MKWAVYRGRNQGPEGAGTGVIPQPVTDGAEVDADFR